MEPTQTANGDYKYETYFCDQKLEDLVQECHEYNCRVNGWYFNKLKVGCYGFDNLAVCIGYVMNNIVKDTPVEKIADLIHQGWIMNYVFWRDEKPWLNKDYVYQKPSKPVNDKRRNLCAVTEYDNLPADEKEKDQILAKWIQSKFLDYLRKEKV